MKIYTIQINDTMTDEEILSHVNETKAMFDRVIDSNPSNLTEATLNDMGVEIVEKNHYGQLELTVRSLNEGKN